MGAKKKGGKGKKGKKGKEEKEPEDHYTLMKGEQLDQTILNLREQLATAKQRRNMLQIENDMISDFAQNTKDEIKEIESEIRNLDTKMQEEEDNHNKEVVSHLQKVQHHEFEHEESLEVIKINGNDFMHQEDEVHNDIERVNRK